MDVMKHKADGGHNKHLKPGKASADKYNGPLPVQQPMDQPDQGASMDPSMGA
jgi:hypothetical protein